MPFLERGGDIKKKFITEEELLNRFVGQELWVWGYGVSGQLGSNTAIAQSSPVQTISGGTTWKQAILGISHSSAIKTDGTLWLWGQGSWGRLGNNSLIDQSSPVQTISGGTNWKQVSIVCASSAIKTDGTLWLWGSGGSGKLGNNSTINQSSPIQTIAGGTNWKQVSLGREHSSAIKTDGTLWLWGIGGSGQLGTNSATNQSSPVQTIAGGTNWKQVSLGGYYNSSAIKTDGTLWLWGIGYNGQLGNKPYCEIPQQLFSETNWGFDTDDSNNYQKTCVASYHSAAIKTDGTLWLWGYGSFGRLGNNSLINQSSPVQTISGGNDWKQVSLGGDHSSAIKTDGTLWLWGNANSGKLGNNTVNIDQSSPVQTISGGNDWKQVSLGIDHSSAIKTDGTLWLWGNANSGKLGNNTVNIDQSSPVQTISGGTNWKQVSLGNGHSSAIKTDGTLWLWGGGGCGRLGNNSIINQSSPVQTISAGTNWKQVSLGTDHSSAIKTDGTLWLWGAGCRGSLGTNNAVDQSSPVQTIAGGTNWKRVSLGCNHSSAIKTDGTLWMWGYNNQGNLGNGDTINRSSPVQVTSSSDWAHVSAGTGWKASKSTIAVKCDGTLWGWGSNGYGQLASEACIPVNRHSSPVQTIARGANWKSISAGQVNAAIKTDGTLWMWGRGIFGGLGNNTTRDFSASPSQTVAGGNNWKDAAGAKSYCGRIVSAIKTDGTLWVWGHNGGGQLGTNNAVNQSSPVQTIAGGTNWKSVSSGYHHIAATRLTE
jgi:alpha-tubulin suppressor-like RCC1 family protein